MRKTLFTSVIIMSDNGGQHDRWPIASSGSLSLVFLLLLYYIIVHLRGE